MILVVMGVAGAGKTTVGRLLAERLGWTFLEADDLHSAASIAKMRRGTPLTDADRAPWLEAVRARILELLARREDAVVACSALKRAYQRRLLADPAVRLVYLEARSAVLRRRLERRSHPFMNPALLASQLADLEEPEDPCAVVDATLEPAAAVEQIVKKCVGAGARPSSVRDRLPPRPGGQSRT